MSNKIVSSRFDAGFQFGLKSQQGSVLIVSLMFLLLLTILGLASIQNTSLQERMAGNFAERNSAFQYAELAIRTAERLHADAISSGSSMIPMHDSSSWPSSCPDIAELGCSGNSVSTDASCLSDLTWQSVDLGEDPGSAQYVVVPVDHAICGTPEDETMSSSNPFGAASLGGPGSGALMLMVLGRGTGPAGTSEVLLQSLYFGGALHGFDGSS